MKLISFGLLVGSLGLVPLASAQTQKAILIPSDGSPGDWFGPTRASSPGTRTAAR